MSDLKRTCPGCNSWSSSIGIAWRNGDPCPSCGLSAAAAAEIDEIRDKRGNDELKERLEKALLERDAALREVSRMYEQFSVILDAVEEIKR
ncbi:hypothetical protein [Glycomyces sp. NPDC048151]|uniref:hypothetical protein n=1 Tax=Glycomyces sp. NPDC048151 TaxID=3364002 RepID=UPI00371EAAED